MNRGFGRFMRGLLRYINEWEFTEEDVARLKDITPHFHLFYTDTRFSHRINQSVKYQRVIIRALLKKAEEVWKNPVDGLQHMVPVVCYSLNNYSLSQLMLLSPERLETFFDRDAPDQKWSPLDKSPRRILTLDYPGEEKAYHSWTNCGSWDNFEEEIWCFIFNKDLTVS